MVSKDLPMEIILVVTYMYMCVTLTHSVFLEQHWDPQTQLLSHLSSTLCLSAKPVVLVQTLISMYRNDNWTISKKTLQHTF